MAKAVDHNAFTIGREEAPDEAGVRWWEHRALGDNALVGLRLGGLVEPTDPGGAALRRVETALWSVDALLRNGCPLLVTIALTRRDLADPDVLARLEAWGRARGGAHGLLGLEVAATGETVSVPWRRIADLGFEISGSPVDLPRGRSPRPMRFVVGSTLVRRAPYDFAAAAEVLALVSRAVAAGSGLLIRGDLDEAAEDWLMQVLRVPAVRESQAVAMARAPDAMVTQLRDLIAPCAVRAPTGRSAAFGRDLDLTWIEVV